MVYITIITKYISKVVTFKLGEIMLVATQFSNSKIEKSVSISFRINKDVYNLLLEQAQDQGISLNSLVNSITKRHLTWERFGEEIGFIPITRRTIKKIFRHLKKSNIEKIANEMGGVVPRELTFLTYGNMDFEKLMNILEVNASRFGKVKHFVEGNKHNLNIHHGICKNFSMFLAFTHKKMCEDLSLKFSLNNLDSNMVCLEIEKV